VSAVTTDVQTVHVDHCDLDMTVTVGGSGPPLVYLHTAGGPVWDPFLEALAEHHTVYAPDHPGTGNTARDAIHRVDSLWDLVLVYDELFDALGLADVPVVGASFGGMMALEVAAHRPALVNRLVLLAPVGLWRDDAPVAAYMLMSPDDLVATLYEDTEVPFIKESLELPEDRHEQAIQIADSVWALATTGKFVWPIPDKGLKKRIHRVRAPALLIWGSEDKLISPVYAEEFRERLPDARVALVEGSGHMPSWERTDEVAALAREFLEQA
jgi:pimeloyl-ACP methyl ester carboxylesterase